MIPTCRIVIADDVRIQLEVRVDILNGCHELASVEVGIPSFVEVDDVVLTLIGGRGVIGLLQHTREWSYIQVDLVPSLLLVVVDQSLKAGEPGRVVDQNGDWLDLFYFGSRDNGRSGRFFRHGSRRDACSQNGANGRASYHNTCSL